MVFIPASLPPTPPPKEEVSIYIEHHASETNSVVVLSEYVLTDNSVEGGLRDNWSASLTVTHNRDPETPKSVSSYTPKTPLGKKFAELRKRIVSSGAKLMTMDEIVAEVEVRRGGVKNKNLH